MAHLNRYVLFTVLLILIAIRYIPSLFYQGGVFEAYGNELQEFNGKMVPLKWILFVHCEMYAWLYEAVLVWFILRKKHFLNTMRVVFFVWMFSRGFDVVQLHFPILLNYFGIVMKMLLNISVLFTAILYLDLDDEK